MMETSTMSMVRRCLRPGSAWLTALLLLMAMVCASMGVAHAAETITYYYTSPQGTVLAKADASGNILSNADYRPYGTQALGTPEQGPGYTGHVDDVDSGLVYMQARYYDPALARFLSADPVELEAGKLFGSNRYAYGDNNPVSNIDPDGRQTQVVDGSVYRYSTDVRDDPLLSTVGRAIAADAAFVVGAATNDRQLQETAVEGMSEVTSNGQGATAVVALMMSGDGEGSARPNVSVGKASTLAPGPYAVESIPGHMGRPSAAEQRQVNGLMSEHGCHTCGTKDPGTNSGNAVADHQPPQALGQSKEFYPHCINCMRRQGGEVRQQKSRTQE